MARAQGILPCILETSSEAAAQHLHSGQAMGGASLGGASKADPVIELTSEIDNTRSSVQRRGPTIVSAKHDSYLCKGSCYKPESQYSEDQEVWCQIYTKTSTNKNILVTITDSKWDPKLGWLYRVQDKKGVALRKEGETEAEWVVEKRLDES